MNLAYGVSLNCNFGQY